RYGNVFEGRAGGIRLPVRGAHSGDYNVNTTGISAMGNFDETAPRRPMRRALVKLIAWRLGTAYHGGFGRIAVEGAQFARISGHRDAMSTSCPGQYIYNWLPTLRERVRTRLGEFVSPIEAQWRTSGGRKSRLGVVRIGEQGENSGHFTGFKAGRMYASQKGIFALYRGPILTRFNKSGGVGGALGYPLSGAFPSGNGTGNGAKFAGGRIYWSAPTDSRLLLRSPVLKRYLTEGGPKGLLGFPTTEIQYTSTGHAGNFEHGTITYSNATGQSIITYS
nr:N-acetylmuramoyl-L-alanine amidase [Nocardioidaceae bacterium]